MTLFGLTVLTLVAQSSLDFKGGTDQMLVDFVRETTKENVAVLSDPARRWPKKRFSFRDMEERDQKLVAFSEGARMPSMGWSLGVADYPTFVLMSRSSRLNEMANHKAKLETREQGKKYSAKTIGGAVDMKRLLAFSFSKHIEWHWFFENVYVNASISNAGEEAYLSLLCKAMGARLVEKPDRYVFDIDPVELRKRGVKTFSEAAANEPKRGGLRATYLFSAEALRLASDKVIRDSYRDPNPQTDVELELRSTALAKLGVEKLKDRFPIEEDGIQRTAADIAMWAKLRPMFDFSKPPKVILTPKGIARAVFYGDDHGKPIRLVL